MSRSSTRTFFLPAENRDAKAEYLEGHIPGAVFFDIDAIADHTTSLPHMLPSPPDFARAMEELGLGDDMRFVVYDASNLQGGARVWWTLRTFGARDVKILAGGLPRWRAETRPLERGPVRRAARRFTVNFDSAAVATAADVKRASESGLGADRRCARRRAIQRHGGRAAPRIALGSYSQQSQSALGRSGRRPAKSNRWMQSKLSSQKPAPISNTPSSRPAVLA